MQEDRMWRDRWFTVGLIGAVLTCVACFTPLAVIGLSAIGLGAWTGRLDVVLLTVLVMFVGIAFYRYRVACRRAP
jgi:mercuric ion transport protein